MLLCCLSDMRAMVCLPDAQKGGIQQLKLCLSQLMSVAESPARVATLHRDEKLPGLFHDHPRNDLNVGVPSSHFGSISSSFSLYCPTQGMLKWIVSPASLGIPKRGESELLPLASPSLSHIFCYSA